MKKLFLSDGSEIEILNYSSNLGSFTTSDRNIYKTFARLTDDNLKTVKIKSYDTGIVDEEEKTIETDLGIFTDLHATSANFDGKNTTYNLTQIDNTEVRFRSLEQALDELIIANLGDLDDGE